MKVELGKKDYLWSYAGVIMSLCASVIMLPFILYYLDADLYGLWSIFTSLTSITTLFDFGFSVTFARNITYCWNGAQELKPEGVVYAENPEPNWKLIKDILTVCRWIYLILSLAAFLLLITAGTAYIRYLSQDIEGWSHIVAWCIYALAAFLNLYYCYFNSFLRGVGAISSVNKCTVIAKLVQIVLTVVFLWLGFGLIGVSIAYLSYGLLFRLLARHEFYSWQGIGEKLKEVPGKTTREDASSLMKVVWHNAWREGLISLSNYLLSQGCTIVSSLYLSLAEVGVYSLAVQLANAVGNISAASYTANQPVLQSAVVTNDNQRVKETMSLIVYSVIAVWIVGVIAVVVLGIPILGLIKPESKVSVPLFLALAVGQLLVRYRNCFSSYFSCTNRIIYTKAFIFSSVLCIVLAVVFLDFCGMGTYGLALAQIVSQLVYNAWYWSLKAHREMGLGCKESAQLALQEMKKNVGKKSRK